MLWIGQVVVLVGLACSTAGLLYFIGYFVWFDRRKPGRRRVPYFGLAIGLAPVLFFVGNLLVVFGVAMVRTAG
ncbi:MAG: hypothetical protein AAF710_09305 [Planctomycetota bacterium]